MRSNKTFGISFFVKKYQKDKNNQVPIYVRISADGKRLDMSVQRKISLDRWDDIRVDTSVNLNQFGRFKVNPSGRMKMSRPKEGQKISSSVG